MGHNIINPMHVQRSYQRWLNEALCVLQTDLFQNKSAAYFFFAFMLCNFSVWMLKYLLKSFNIFFAFMLCNFSVWMLKYLKKKKLNFFCPQKVEKTTAKSCILKQKFHRFRNFLFTAQQPKWQKTYSKKWLIGQLYIELGI